MKATFKILQRKLYLTDCTTQLIREIKLLFVAFVLILATPIIASAQTFEANHQRHLKYTCNAKYHEDKDYEAAFPWCARAANWGFVSAQFILATMYGVGQGRDIDYEQALYWYTHAAKKGHNLAQYNLALMCDLGEGTPEDDKQAVNWYTKAAKQRHSRAQLDLGIMFYFGHGTPKDNVTAYAWFNALAAKGNEQAAKIKIWSKSK